MLLAQYFILGMVAILTATFLWCSLDLVRVWWRMRSSKIGKN